MTYHDEHFVFMHVATQNVFRYPLTPELYPAACRDFLLRILIFKGLTARRLYKSFSIEGVNSTYSKDEAGIGEGRSVVIHVENFDPKQSNSLSRWFPAVCGCQCQLVDGVRR
jgi:hypothetical protein